MRILITHPVILNAPKERVVKVGEIVDLPEGIDYSQFGRLVKASTASALTPAVEAPPDTLSALARLQEAQEALRAAKLGVPPAADPVPGAAPPPPRPVPQAPPAAPADDLLS